MWGRERRLPIMDFTNPKASIRKNIHSNLYTLSTLLYSVTHSHTDSLRITHASAFRGKADNRSKALRINPWWKRVRSAGGLIWKIFFPEAQRRQELWDTKRDHCMYMCKCSGMCVAQCGHIICTDNTNETSLECATVFLCYWGLWASLLFLCVLSYVKCLTGVSSSKCMTVSHHPFMSHFQVCVLK